MNHVNFEVCFFLSSKKKLDTLSHMLGPAINHFDLIYRIRAVHVIRCFRWWLLTANTNRLNSFVNPINQWPTLVLIQLKKLAFFCIFLCPSLFAFTAFIRFIWLVHYEWIFIQFYVYMRFFTLIAHSIACSSYFLIR